MCALAARVVAMLAMFRASLGYEGTEVERREGRVVRRERSIYSDE